jgi:hypothetical protein
MESQADSSDSRPPQNGNKTWLKFGQIVVEKPKFIEKSQYKST